MGSPPQRTVGKWGEDGGEGDEEKEEMVLGAGPSPVVLTERGPSMRWGWGCCVCWWSRCFPG